LGGKRKKRYTRKSKTIVSALEKTHLQDQPSVSVIGGEWKAMEGRRDAKKKLTNWGGDELKV